MQHKMIYFYNVPRNHQRKVCLEEEFKSGDIYLLSEMGKAEITRIVKFVQEDATPGESTLILTL